MNKDNTILAENISAQYLALCPLDGRYAQIGKKLAPYFSEYALVKNRVRVEVSWLKFLLENIKDHDVLRGVAYRDPNIMAIYEDFSIASYVRVKEIEKVTDCDVKAVERFVAEKLGEMGMASLGSFVHMGCTSKDIINPAYANMIKTALKEVWIPAAEKLIESIFKIAIEHADTAMLARIPEQPATPTTVEKEFAVYVNRLRESLENIKSIKIRAKFNGATGNYSAISVAFPNYNWPELSKVFVEEYLGLDFNPVTTRIESYDYICHIADGIRHFNNVLLGFNEDMGMYISMEYFKQIAVKTEVGSSVMSHKDNSICFKNSESNIDMSNAIFMTLSNKLPRPCMQDVLSYSSPQRNIGLAFAYSLQAIEQTIDVLEKVAVNEAKISTDLDGKWEVLVEPIETVLRKYGVLDAYNQMKELTRGKDISKEDIHAFIESHKVFSDEDKEMLLKMTPSSYASLASRIL